MTKEKILKGLKWFFESFIWLAVLMLAIDIISKNVIWNASGGVENVVVWDTIPGFLNCSMIYNPKATFGMGFSSPEINRWFFICAAGAGAIAISVFFGFKMKKMSKITRACLMLILAGALGNFCDRAFYSWSNYAVIDWINFHAIWQSRFNIADSCVVIGVIMLIIVLIVEEVKEYKAQKSRDVETNEKVLSKEEQRRVDEQNSENVSK